MPTRLIPLPEYGDLLDLVRREMSEPQWVDPHIVCFLREDPVTGSLEQIWAPADLGRRCLELLQRLQAMAWNPAPPGDVRLTLARGDALDLLGIMDDVHDPEALSECRDRRWRLRKCLLAILDRPADACADRLLS